MYLNNNECEEILNGSNNILAIEYLKALKRQKSKIMPIGIKRQKVFYNSKKIVDEYASSTGIRYLLERKQIDEVARVMPRKCFEILIDNIRKGRFNLKLTAFSKEILYTLRKMSIEQISKLADVSEGLEFAIKNSANSCNSLVDFFDIIKSKRYTTTRLQRILLYALLGITKKDMALCKKVQPYIRVLGLNNKGKFLISEIAKANPKLEIITSVKKFIDSNPNKNLLSILDKDIWATNVYTLGYEENSCNNLDFTNKIITL